MDGYNISGLIWPAITRGGLWLIGTLIFLIESRFWNAEKRKIKSLVVACIFLVATIAYTSHFINQATNLKVEMCEGVFVKEQSRSRIALFTREYEFRDSYGKDTWCHIDSISRRFGVWPEKDGVWPEGFEEGVRYRVYYDANTDIIVKVEKLE